MKKKFNYDTIVSVELSKPVHLKSYTYQPYSRLWNSDGPNFHHIINTLSIRKINSSNNLYVLDEKVYRKSHVKISFINSEVKYLWFDDYQSAEEEYNKLCNTYDLK